MPAILSKNRYMTIFSEESSLDGVIGINYKDLIITQKYIVLQLFEKCLYYVFKMCSVITTKCLTYSIVVTI